MPNTNELSYIIKDISDSIEKCTNNNFKRFGITMTQFRVLEYLQARGERQTSQKDIETHLQCSHPTVVGILARLQDKGLVRCWMDETDRRIKNVRLTEKEADFFREVSESREALEAQLTHGLNLPQIVATQRVLTIMLRNLQQQEQQ